MRLLVATPWTATHYDAGRFWIKAFEQLGHQVHAWDYRAEPAPHPSVVDRVDASIVFKGESVVPALLPRPAICYWPDRLERTPGIEQRLAAYAHVFTPCRPTPEGLRWLPSGWDPDLHQAHWISKIRNTVYVGTNNSEYKRQMVEAINPELLAGNGWGAGHGPVYHDELVKFLNEGKVLINIHQDPRTGVNRKLFEMIACGLTVGDRPPGVEEVLGRELTAMTTFSTPETAHELVDRLLTRLSTADRLEIWHEQRKRIAPYSYREAAKKMLEVL